MKKVQWVPPFRPSLAIANRMEYTMFLLITFVFECVHLGGGGLLGGSAGVGRGVHDEVGVVP